MDLKEFIFGGIWATPDVSYQPMITLIRWSIMETTIGERYFVGYNIDDREGRVSTPIQSFNPKTLQGITKSGRVYQLVGESSYDSDGSWVWSAMVRILKTEYKDVSNEIEELIKENLEK